MIKNHNYCTRSQVALSSNPITTPHHTERRNSSNRDVNRLLRERNCLRRSIKKQKTINEGIREETEKIIEEHRRKSWGIGFKVGEL